jgi:hypothetical protein
MAINSFSQHTQVLNNPILMEGNHPENLTNIQVHELLRKFKSHLENSQWEPAYYLFIKIPVDIKTALYQSVEQRRLTLPFDFGFDLKNPEEVIDYCLIRMFLEDPSAQNEIPCVFKFLKEYILPETQRYLLKNFQQEKNRSVNTEAHESVNATMEKIIFSSNFPNKGNRLIEHLIPKTTINKKNITFLDLNSNLKIKYRNVADTIDDRIKTQREERNEFVANQPKVDDFLTATWKSQLLSKEGNCFEMAHDVFFRSLKKGKKVDIYRLKGGKEVDHVFVVYNRKNTSHSTVLSTWGINSTVGDPWTDEENVFPAFDIPLFLENYMGYDESTGMPKTERFDPKKHALFLEVSNIYSLNDFIEKTNYGFDQNALDWFQHELDHFHTTRSMERKISIANRIISNHPKIYQKGNKKVVKSLISQMRCFLDFSYVDVYNIGPIATNKSVPILQGNYVTALSIDYMIKIARLFEKDRQNQTTIGLKKFKKFPQEARDFVFRQIEDGIKNQGYQVASGYGEEAFNQIDGLDTSNSNRAKALYAWVIDKLQVALQNYKYEEACKIFDKLPAHVRQTIREHIGRDADLIHLYKKTQKNKN